MPSAARHVPAFLLFALLAIAFSWPLAAHLGDGVLGAGAGDNMSALWNIWWARTAIRGPDHLFWTPALFAPLGTGLALHSFAPLESVAAALLTTAEPPASYNLALIVTVFLNMSCGYWAAWAITRDPLASCFAAVAFGGAPCLLVRLHGHLNVLSAWGLPLLLVAIRRFERVPRADSVLVLGGVLALLAYTDAYYAIFGVTLLIVHIALSRWPPRLLPHPATAGRRRLLGAGAVLILALCVVIAWIESTGGTDTTIAGIRLRMTDSFNLRVIFGLLLVGVWLTWSWPLVAIDRPEVGLPLPWRRVAAAGVVAAILASPLLVAGFQLWRDGDYESQTYFWRSAPPGIDLAALAIGNPLGVLNGGWTAAVYDRLSIDRSESAVWMGLAPLMVLSWGLGQLRSRPEARRYLWIAGLFLVWALGPYLRVLGVNTMLMLPQTVLRFVPLVANARIPGRAFVVVQLMVAVLGAMALAAPHLDSRRKALVALLALAAVIVDFWPTPHPWTPIDRPAIYDTLKAEPAGIVLEVPLGVRDGFGSRGAIDHRVLFYQTVHEHPLMGGFVARLSSRIRTAYDTDPIIGPILDLSEGRTPASPALPAQCLLTCDVRYVVIDEAGASDALEAFVARSFSLRLLARSGPRALYAVD